MASIEKRGINSWRLIVEAGYDSKGKRIKRTKTVRVEDQALLRTTKKLREFLETELHKFKIEVEAGEYIAPEKIKFSAFVEEWWEKYAIKHLGLKTLYVYEKNLKNRIIPTFGNLRLDEIKPIHIINYLHSLDKDGGRSDGKKGGLSSGSIQFDHRIIKNILSRAVEWNLIKNNPAANVKQPKLKCKVYIPYGEKEVEQLLQALQEEPYHWRTMITLALTTGMRRGELLGLEWEHIDWEIGAISVQQNLIKALKDEVVIKDPKTKNSKRKVTLPTSVLEELKNYYSHYLSERKKLGDAWKGCVDVDGINRNFVFCHHDGTPFHHDQPSLWFRRFIKKHGLRSIRFHDLRHTSATLLINQGVHAKVISERLGHGNITTTMNIYGHLLQTADKAAADKFENILSFKNQKHQA
ncbi:tyrosine-type recombinase/integrase [Paenibacillus larvae]|uniref:Phage integrase family protein n=1 Tax=Paenibacillus larvae subsp. larvae TaxID=147375 RepID=A0A2L1U2H3_9BACL|nr:tyrosine-type recombinase/integrase [Paenibacillus larvae]AVF27130.1 phage integrase family protein [Paenibacillus larvae subsp. larvae]MBH0341184.1 integrase [Paenibacillus larvae]MCY9501581.1 site-specific integrase [Paenibacillus larvae]MCY9679250.1 site-specific integrase [Paenibacillus larvae]MCY9747240.1 site-specific integrase [Paenibacillus larvae]